VSLRARIGWTLAIANVAFILAATLTPVAHPIPEPFAANCYFCGDAGGVDVLLNLLLFLPLGFGLRLVGARWWMALAACAGLSAFVETMQLLVVSGRDASLSDWVNNSGGGMLGFALAAWWRDYLLPVGRQAGLLAAAGAALFVAVTVTTAVAMEPAVSGIAAVRLRSEAAHYAFYRGAVIEGELGGVPIQTTGADSLYHTPPGLPVVIERRAQLRGRVTATAGRATEALASLGGLFLGYRSLLILGQERRVLLFSVRLRAADFKLREPRASITAFFPDSGGRPGIAAEGDSIYVGGVLAGDTLRLRATIVGPSGRRAVEHALVLSPFLGWWTILFWTLYAGPTTVAVLTAAWVAGLLFPCAYWSARAWPATPWAVLAPAAAILLGVIGVPARTHRTPAPWWVWAGAAGGLLVGGLLARGAGALERHAAADRERRAGTSAAPMV
jgi:VanZ like family